MTQKVMLYFPQCETEKPIVSHLVRDYELMVNIFRAKVTQDDEGYLVLDLDGTEENIKKALNYLKGLGIDITETQTSIRWDQQRCTSCGNCLPHCKPGALSIENRKTMEVSFRQENCVECMTCLKICPFGALSSLF